MKEKVKKAAKFDKWVSEVLNPKIIFKQNK